MATLELPAMGYGIRYEYGIFEQRIENGYQLEASRQLAAIWQLRRSYATILARTALLWPRGNPEDERGQTRVEWLDTKAKSSGCCTISFISLATT